MIPRIFNALPAQVKMISDDKVFICKIREITLKRQFYDMNEFFICNFESVLTCNTLTYFKSPKCKY